MSAKNLRIGPESRMLGRRLGAHRGVVHLLLTVLVVLVAACQRAPAATEQWMPPYLDLHLYAGKAQVQWSDGSEWNKLEGKASIVIENKGRITADAVEGAQFYLGDGSTLEMGPGTVIEVQNPRTFPRLQVVVRDGSLLFFAQKPSYEFVIPACSVTLLSVPALIRVEVNGETTRLAVEEGAVTCELETGTLTLPTCREMTVRPGEEEPDVTEFCTPNTVIAPPTPTPSPDSTPLGFELTATPSPSASPTPSPTPMPTRREVVPTFTPTPVPPTKPPAPPKPRPTKPPPPPTEPPPPPPPTEPPPPPTEPPEPTRAPPEPTRAPPEPTRAPPEPTSAPPEPTRAQTEPTSPPPEPTSPPPEPTSAPPRPTTEPS
jgi:hypothetical protein